MMENQLQKLFEWAFVSNGIMSADKRIVDNTKRINIVENYPCRNGCVFEKHQEGEEDMKNRKRSFKIADIANYIQLAVLFLLLYGMFFQ